MGYKEYDLVSVNDTELQPTKEQGLGLFANSDRVRNVKLSEFSWLGTLRSEKLYVLIVTKGNTASRIHRPAYNDYIGIKKFDKNGKGHWQHRAFHGSTLAVYNQTVESIPLVREKVERI